MPNAKLAIALSVLTICVALFGMSLSFASIVSDRSVIDRERRWGIGSPAVVVAKWTVLSAFAFAQAILIVFVLALFKDGPTEPLIPVAGVLLAEAVTVVLLAFAAMSLGLLLSTLSRSLQQAVVAMTAALAVIVVLTGLLIPL